MARADFPDRRGHHDYTTPQTANRLSLQLDAHWVQEPALIRQLPIGW